MSMRWGRAKRTGGPSIQPVYTHALVLLSFFGTLGIQALRYERIWTPLERHYFPAYLDSQIAGVVRDNNWYTLLQVVARKGSRLALDSDVIPTVTESGKNSFALTEEALKHGALRLEPHRGYYNSAEMHAYLGNLIYQNQTSWILSGQLCGLGWFCSSRACCQRPIWTTNVLPRCAMGN